MHSSQSSSQHVSETKNLKNFQIKISQDGEFAMTFDTTNLRAKIYRNTDYRQFTNSKYSNKTFNNNHYNDIIDKIIADFVISNNLNTIKIYDDPNNDESQKSNQIGSNESNQNKYRWSFDISSLQTSHNDENFIFVAISCIDLIKDMKGEDRINIDETIRSTKNEYKKNQKNHAENNLPLIKEPKESTDYIKYRINNNDHIIDMDHLINDNESINVDKNYSRKTIIYRFKINKLDDITYNLDMNYIPTYCIYNYISGIPKFINKDNEDSKDSNKGNKDKNYEHHDRILERLVLLNFNGIYNFEYNHEDGKFNLNERFDYPKSFEDELNNWHTKNLPDCMDRILSCLTNKYFLVEKYKDKVQVIEVYNLAKMKLKTAAKTVKNKNRHIKKYDNKNDFTISQNKLLLCYTQGYHTVKLFLVENGLRIAAKNFEDKIEKINLVELVNNDETLLIIGIDKEENPIAIPWDLFNTGNIGNSIPLKSISGLARASGNVLQVDNQGKVRSILKIIEQQQELENIKKWQNIETRKKVGDIVTITGVKLDEYCEESTIGGKEPWVMDNYKTYSFLLCNKDEETLKLIVGRSTVQIWHQIHPNSTFRKEENCCPNKAAPFLEYIWTNGVPLDQESDATSLHIKKIEYGDKYLNLEVYWHERNVKKERTIQWDDIVEKVIAVRSACKALEHLNKRKRYLSNFPQKHCYEEMVVYIRHIIWRFIDHYPDQYRLLDVRHNVMKSLILADCDHLIKYILFGNDKDNCNGGNMKQKENFVIKHVPRSITWKKDQRFVNDDDLDPFDRDKNSRSKKTEPTNDLELAIYHCRELRDTMIVAFFLEYYTSHAIEYAGWMTTVSKALPFLYKYNYDDYVKKLFRKECFADQDHLSSQDPYEIIPKGFMSGRFREKNFMAFRPKSRLQSDKDSAFNITMKKLFFLDNNHVRNILKFFDNGMRKIRNNDLERSPISLRVVPLPRFTRNDINKNIKTEFDKDYSILLKIFWFLFIPRWYKIGKSDHHLLSPFARVTKYEDNDSMYDNPITEAVIDFRWRSTRAFFILLFLRFIIFSICFVFISWAYLTHEATEPKFQSFLVFLIILFYYLAAYLLITEIIQLFHHGFKEYFGTIFNYFDLISIILPTIVMYYILGLFELSDGFGNVKVDRGLIVGISMSIFVLWIEFVNFISSPNFMYVLLKNPDVAEFKANTFSGTATNKNESLDINIQSNFDEKDNPFSEFLTSVEAAYFWTTGNWVQKDMFDFWAVDLVSIIASILFVTILQNMFIALMGGVYERAANKGRQALLRFRARQIADYEALHHIHFWPHEPDPKYIYYVGKSKNFEEWSKKTEQCVIYKDFEEKSTYIKYNFQKADYDDYSIWRDYLKGDEK
ncbi:hypothetical protein RclHR1_15290001 [Rhizophagus clarus]|uniref:Ion transport domain-containing protein n=1 Tax=Rhizophagus clarus TaxID=94130 RepID=A0A2Z6QEZ8_9GLOM|nr:hypothetical protein RclHR1_15290001 [Rhizophagus clarus]